MIHCHVFSSKTLTSRDLFEVFAVFAVLLRCYVQSVSFVGSFEGTPLFFFVFTCTAVSLWVCLNSFQGFTVFAVILRCHVLSGSFLGIFDALISCFCCRSWFALHSRFYRGLIISSLYSLSFLNDSNLFAKTRLSFITLLFFVLEVV